MDIDITITSRPFWKDAAAGGYTPITGGVAYATGLVASGVTVELFRRVAGSSTWDTVILATTTDSMGAFSFTLPTGLAAGDYEYIARADGKLSTVLRQWVHDGVYQRPPGGVPSAAVSVVAYNRGSSAAGFSYGDIYNASGDFVRDATAAGTGTDQLANFAASFGRAVTQASSKQRITYLLPPGDYFCADELSYTFPSGFKHFRLVGEGARLCHNWNYDAGEGLAYQSRQMIELKTAANDGDECIVQGLTTELMRASKRVGGCSGIHIAGFRRTIIEGCSVPRSENHGIMLNGGDGGGDTTGFFPELYIVRGNTIGSVGRAIGDTSQGSVDDNGSIGDSGIWTKAPAAQVEIVGNTVINTGDDGIFIGHSGYDLNRDSTRRAVNIHGNNTKFNGAMGIKVMIPEAQVYGNMIDMPLNTGIMVACDDVLTNGIGGDRTRVYGNTITRVGHLTTADTESTTNIGAQNQYGILINAGNVDVFDNYIDNTINSGIRLKQPDTSHGQTTYSDVRIFNNKLERIGCSRDGLSLTAESAGMGAIERQSGTGPITKVRIYDNLFKDSNQPFLLYSQTSSGITDDDWWLRRNRVSGVTLSATRALCYFNGGGTAALTNFDGGTKYDPGFIIDASSSINRLARIVGGSLTPANIKVEAEYSDDLFAGYDMTSTRFTAVTNNAAIQGFKQWGPLRRDATASADIICVLNAAESHHFWVETFSTDADKDGLVYEFLFDHVGGLVTVVNAVKRSGTTDDLPVNIAATTGYFIRAVKTATTTEFSGGRVEITARHGTPASWTNTMRVQVWGYTFGARAQKSTPVLT